MTQAAGPDGMIIPKVFPAGGCGEERGAHKGPRNPAGMPAFGETGEAKAPTNWDGNP